MNLYECQIMIAEDILDTTYYFIVAPDIYEAEKMIKATYKCITTHIKIVNEPSIYKIPFERTIVGGKKVQT